MSSCKTTFNSYRNALAGFLGNSTLRDKDMVDAGYDWQTATVCNECRNVELGTPMKFDYIELNAMCICELARNDPG